MGAAQSAIDQRPIRFLLAAAKALGNRIRTFETAEQQMRFFADLPAEVELELLRETLKSYKNGPVQIRKMEAA